MLQPRAENVGSNNYFFLSASVGITRRTKTCRRHNRAPPRPPKGLLSLRDYTVIHTALEMVVFWGLAPVLEPGVGVFDADKRPRSRAIKVSRRILRWGGCEAGESTRAKGQQGRDNSVPRDVDGRCDGHGASGGAADSGAGGIAEGVVASTERLTMCAEVIQDVVFTQQFMPMLMPFYLPDLLAARLQLVYGLAARAAATVVPQPANVTGSVATGTVVAAAALAGASVAENVSPEASKEAAETSPKPSSRAGTNANGNNSVHFPRNNKQRNDRADEQEALRDLLRDLGPRQVMGALRHLLSQGTRTPPWLRQRAGRILSQIVLRPGGVQATLEVYLAATGGGGGAEGGEGDEMRACLRVARLLAAPPKSVSTREYVSRVAPQLAEMLHYDGQQRAIITRQEGREEGRGKLKNAPTALVL